jgi:AhpD family alkylhydroperoxidase
LSRLIIPARDEVPEASKPILDAVHKQLGTVPNMFRLIAQSPAVLQGYVANNGALARALDVKTRERIALAVAQVNGCDDCLSAHSYLGLNLAKLGPEEVALNRKGKSGDAKANEAVRFAIKVARARLDRSPRLTSRRSATPDTATARSSRSSPSPLRTSSPTCSTWSRRPTSTSRSCAPTTRLDASEGWRLSRSPARRSPHEGVPPCHMVSSMSP